MATTEEIKKTAILVRDATQIGENTAERVGGVLVDLANKSKELEDNIDNKADKDTVNAALDKKFDKSEIVQTTGEAEDKVMSQKTVSNKLSDLNTELEKKFDKESIAQELSDDETKVASSKCVKAAIDETSLLLRYKKSKIALIGDSISTFKGYIPENFNYYYPNGKIDSVDKTYWHILAESLSAKVQNLSFSGSTVTNQNPYGTFNSRTTMVNDDAALIIVALGTNDTQKEDSVGDINYNEEIDNYDESVFSDAYLKGVKTLMKEYPYSDILLVVMSNSKGMTNRARVIQEIASHYGLMFFDARNSYSGGLHPDTDETDDGTEMQQIAEGIILAISGSLDKGSMSAINKVCSKLNYNTNSLAQKSESLFKESLLYSDFSVVESKPLNKKYFNGRKILDGGNEINLYDIDVNSGDVFRFIGKSLKWNDGIFLLDSNQSIIETIPAREEYEDIVITVPENAVKLYVNVTNGCLLKRCYNRKGIYHDITNTLTLLGNNQYIGAGNSIILGSDFKYIKLSEEGCYRLYTQQRVQPVIICNGVILNNNVGIDVSSYPMRTFEFEIPKDSIAYLNIVYTEDYNIEKLEDRFFVAEEVEQNNTLPITSNAVFEALQKNSSGTPIITIASSNASTNAKLNSMYICKGINDEEEINKAIKSLPNGGTVCLSEGLFFINSPIVIDRTITLVGSGAGCELTLENPSNRTTSQCTILQAASNTDIINVKGGRGYSIHDLGISGYGVLNDDNTSWGIKINGWADIGNFYNLSFSDCFIAIGNSVYTDTYEIHNCSIQRNKLGIFSYRAIGLRIHDNMFCENVGIQETTINLDNKEQTLSLYCANIAVLNSSGGSKINNNCFWRAGLILDKTLDSYPISCIYTKTGSCFIDSNTFTMSNVGPCIVCDTEGGERIVNICNNFFESFCEKFGNFTKSEHNNESKYASAIIIEPKAGIIVVKSNTFALTQNVETARFAVYQTNNKDNIYNSRWYYATSIMDNYVYLPNIQTENDCFNIVSTENNYNKVSNNVIIVSKQEL